MVSQRKIGAVLGYANIVVKSLVNLAYTPMLLAFVGQADFGVFQTSNSFVFSLSLLSFGFYGAYVRYYTREKVQGNEQGVRSLNGMYLALYLVVSIVALFLGLALASNASLFFTESFTYEQEELASSLMAVMAVSVAVTLFSTVFDAYITACEQFRFQQVRQLLATLATPFAALGLLCLGMGAVGVALAQLVVYVALLLLNARFAIMKLGMRFDVRHFDAGSFRAIAIFSGWVFVGQVCDLVNQSVPNILLGVASGAIAVSVFAVAVQIRSVFVSLSVAMSNVFVPEVNRIVATFDDNTELTRLMTRVGRYQMLLFCWVYCGFVLLGRFFVSRWAGEGFSDAYYLICAMSLPLAVPLCQNIGIEIQKAKNRHKTRSLIMLGMAVLNVVFTLIASPYLGCWAAAIAYIASIALGNGLFMNWYYQKRIGLDMAFFWKRNLPVVLVSTAIATAGLFVLQFAPVENWLSFVVWGLAYSAVFAVAMWVFVLDGGEKAMLATRIPMKR